MIDGVLNALKLHSPIAFCFFRPEAKEGPLMLSNYLVLLHSHKTSDSILTEGIIWCLPVSLLLFYARATVFQLYHGGNIMYEMRGRKPEPAPLPTQVIFNLPHHIGRVGEELAFGDAVSYTQQGNELQYS